MNTITKAQEVKAQTHLAGLTRYNGIIMKRSEFLEQLKKDGYTPETAEVPAVQYDRRKFNRMNWQEQQVYEKRLAEKKTEYRAQSNDDSGFFTLTTTEYKYFCSLF